MKFNRKKRAISYIMEVVMMTLVVTALASVVLTWGISTISESRAALGGAVRARMDRLQEGLVVQDIQMINSTYMRVWIRNSGSIQIVIDQIYVNNVQTTIYKACTSGVSPTGVPPAPVMCPSGTRLSLPIQAVGAVDVKVSTAIVVDVITGTASSTGTTTTLIDNESWVTNQWAACTVTITSGTDSGQGAKTIASNIATVLTISGTPWTLSTDLTSQYTISSAGMCSAATYTVIAATTRGTTFQGSFTV